MSRVFFKKILFSGVFKKLLTGVSLKFYYSCIIVKIFKHINKGDRKVSEIRKRIGREIRLIRAQRDLTQPAFARFFNETKPPEVREITQQDLSKYETGATGIKVEVLEHIRSLKVKRTLKED